MPPKKTKKKEDNKQGNGLSPLLYDSYKRYKDDTQRLIAWLMKAAKDCGYPSTNIKTCNDLRQLAKHVSTHATSILPASIFAVGQRAISLRKMVTESFLNCGSSPKKTQRTLKNKTHAYFIQVLEEILDLFQSPAKKQPSQSPADAKSWLNSFAALTVEETDDSPDTGAKVDSSEAAEVAKVLDEEENGPEFLSHGFFQLLCLFHDLQRWRSFISETWAEYAKSEIDLTSAAVVTDQALKFSKELIAETIKNLPEGFPADEYELQSLIMAYGVEVSGPDLPPSTELGLPFNVKHAGLIDYCFLTTGILLHSFIPIIQQDSIPSYKPGYFGVYDPKANRARMSFAEKFNEDKVLLLELLPEYAIIGMSKTPMPAYDEITLGLMDFIDEKKYGLWLSFAAQLQLDSIHATRYSRLRPFDDLRMTSLRIARTIDDFWKLSETHPHPQFWPKEGDEQIKTVREHIANFVETDGLLEAKKLLSKALAAKHQAAEQLLFIRNPILCGIFAFYLTLHMQTLGQALVTQWFDVQQLAFLYSLVQRVPGYENLSWPDMELFIKIHGEDHIFMGSRPQNADQALGRLEIVTGISSATRFASDSRKKQSEWHTADGKAGRRLTPTTKTANLLRQYYAPEERRGGFPRHSIEGSALSEYLNELFETTKKGKDEHMELSTASPHSLLSRKWHNQRNVSFVQLLTLMKAQLFEEEPFLMFNYFAMHRRSMELLRLIRDKEHEKFVQYFTSAYLPDDSFIQNIVLLILHVARGSAKNAQQLGFAKANTGSRIVASCGEVMKTYLEKNGAIVTKELRTFGRNKAALSNLNDNRKITSAESMQKEYYWFGIEEMLSPAQIEALRTGISVG